MDEFIDVVIEKSNGEQWELEIEKDENEELGLEFENGLMVNIGHAVINVCFVLLIRCHPV